MNRQAWIAWLLILLQAAMFWYMSDGDVVLFPVLITLVGLSAVWWRGRWEISSGYLPAAGLNITA